MRLVYPLLAYPLLAVAGLAGFTDAAFKPSKAVLLSKVASLTLRKDALTANRRVPPIPQLRCTGGNAKGLYEIDVMRCKNQGADYEDEDIQWTCQASLPPEFKLGSTDVICEGYDSPDDPYVLKGSCGVEYRLVLTEEGEEQYGRPSGSSLYDNTVGQSGSAIFSLLFWMVFIIVGMWIIYGAFIRPYLERRPGRNPIRFPWGGGGGGGDDPGNDPPPPYDHGRPPKTYPASSSPSMQQQAWRPAFWTGALGGAAAGYYAANQRQPNRTSNERGTSSWWNNGEGSSRGASRPSPNNNGGGGGSSYSSTRYESTGFGSTRRR